MEPGLTFALLLFQEPKWWKWNRWNWQWWPKTPGQWLRQALAAWFSVFLVFCWFAGWSGEILRHTYGPSTGVVIGILPIVILGTAWAFVLLLILWKWLKKLGDVIEED